MYYIRSESSFDSAHFLKGYAGKCSNLHGHRWRVVVELQAEELIGEGQMRGMVLDFGDLKKFLGGMCDKLDHCLICESGSLRRKTIQADRGKLRAVLLRGDCSRGISGTPRRSI